MSSNDFLKAKAYVNGNFIESNDKIEIFSAIDGTSIGELPSLKKNDIDKSFEGSYRAFDTWKNIIPSMRIKKIKEFAEEFIKDKERLSNLMILEIAKSKKDAIAEIERSYEYILNTIKVFEDEFINPTIIDESIHGIKGKTGNFYQEPIGVILAISPFNYPINLSISKIIPAILTGNTVVFKPATQGALTASLLAEYFHKVNLIPGVFNLVTGKGSEIGDYIIENKRIAGCSFTGSSKVGKKIAENLPMKQIVLELGGKDVAIVTKYADLEKAAKEIIKGAFGYSGQRCTAIKKVLVMEEVAYDLTKLLIKNMELLEVGNPFLDVDVVPLIDKNALDYNLELINDALKKGAELKFGGKVVGYNLLEPTLLDNVSYDARIFSEEQFGPTLPIVHIKNIEEGIKIANNSEFGLQGSIFSENEAEANKIAKRLNTGSVNINKSSSRGPDIFPFIGIKNSGFGVQGIRESLKSVTRIKGIINNK